MKHEDIKSPFFEKLEFSVALKKKACTSLELNI